MPWLVRLFIVGCCWVVLTGLAAAQPPEKGKAEAPPAAEKPAEEAPAPPKAEAAKPDAATPAAPAGGESKVGGGSAMIEFLFMSVTGWILNVTYFVFIALTVYLVLDLRAGAMMPLDFIDGIEDLLNKRKFKEAFDLAKADNSMIGRVMTAGMTRLQNGLHEARDAAEAMLENLRARKEAVMSYVAIIGTLGPLIGLVGTVAGMIQTFAELGQGGSPNPAKLASGISHALNATLVGIFLSVLAIPAFSFFKNRLARIVLDVALLADDLLTQMHHASRNPAAPSPPVPSTAAPVRPAATVPNPTAPAPTKPA
jgi:biopolymer transport protein ExbB